MADVVVSFYYCVSISSTVRGTGTADDYEATADVYYFVILKDLLVSEMFVSPKITLFGIVVGVLPLMYSYRKFSEGFFYYD